MAKLSDRCFCWLPAGMLVPLGRALPFHIPEAWKRYPFWAEPPRMGHYREYPPPPGRCLLDPRSKILTKCEKNIWESFKVLTIAKRNSSSMWSVAFCVTGAWLSPVITVSFSTVFSVVCINVLMFAHMSEAENSQKYGTTINTIFAVLTPDSRPPF